MEDRRAAVLRALLRGVHGGTDHGLQRLPRHLSAACLPSCVHRLGPLRLCYFPNSGPQNFEVGEDDSAKERHRPQGCHPHSYSAQASRAELPESNRHPNL